MTPTTAAVMAASAEVRALFARRQHSVDTYGFALESARLITANSARQCVTDSMLSSDR